MNKTPQNILVAMIPDYFTRTMKIPEIQREDTAWSLEQKQLLIDSLYNNYDIPKLYLRKDTKDKTTIWWVLDGQQRLKAIADFLNNEFSMGEFSTLPESVRNKPVSELQPDEKDKILSRTLDFILLECTPDEEEDLFLRLNKGTPLNAAEKRNAIRGEVRTTVIELAKHKFFDSKINFSASRYAIHAVSAQLVLLTLAGGSTDAKGRQLEELYRSKKRFQQKKKVAAEIVYILNWMNRIFKQKEMYMKKYNVLSIFLFLRELRSFYSIKGISDSELYNFIHKFEKERLQNNQISEDDTKFDRDLNAYTLACIQSPDSEESLRIRFTLLLKKFLIDHRDLPLKDNLRDFTAEQKTTIYYICDKKCSGVKGFACPMKGEELAFEDCEFDHIKEYDDAGPTSVANGQVLCHDCHAYKTALYRKKKSKK